MMKKTLKLASLTFLMFGCAVASEFRPALCADKGPQRLDMNVERANESDWEFDIYSVGYSRDAVKTYAKHGMNTAPLSTLIFGKESFKISDALAAKVDTDPAGNALTTAYSQEFNSNLDSTTLFPRVTYNEQGINLGAAIGYRVWEGKGRVGVRVNVPLKTIRMERDNNAETAEAGGVNINVVESNSFTADQIQHNTFADAAANLLYDQTPVLSNMYRVSFIKNLPFVRAGQVGKFIDSATVGVNGNNNPVMQIANGGAYAREQVLNSFANTWNGGYKAAQALPYAVFYTEDPKLPPMLTTRAMALRDPLSSTANPLQLPDATDIRGSIVDIGNKTLQARSNGAATGAVQQLARPVSALPADGAGMAANTAYVFTVDALAGAGANAPAQITRVADYKNLLATKGDNLWIVTTHAADGTKMDQNTDGILQGLIKRYGSQSAEQWLWMNGYTMQNNQRTGLGDITVTPCYDHVFSPEWQGGVYAHLLIPTGGSRKMGDNPYKARLGNDNHVEVGAGANVAWQALSFANVRLDVMAAYAMPAKERVAAPFKGATIKALGPVVDADIDYTRIKASVDTTIVHPKASSLATTIGYDFEFKTKDNVSLKSKDFTFKKLADDKNSWFGGFWDNTLAGANPIGFTSKTVALDSAVLSKNTERISHNVRVESSWHATEKLSMFWGGSAPVAGQNVAKMTSIYGGINVKY